MAGKRDCLLALSHAQVVTIKKHRLLASGELNFAKVPGILVRNRDYYAKLSETNL